MLCYYLRSFIKGCHICQLDLINPNVAIATLNLFELQTVIKIKYGFERDAQITKRSQIHLMHH